MNQELKLIKKYYGEEMMHYARDNFATLLEKEGLLLSLLDKHFYRSKNLFYNLKNNGDLKDFKFYIYSLVGEVHYIMSNKTPFELMDEAGYTLYECNTENDIQKFKKYYADEEELCTFKGGRLNYCHVFFAVKKNVNEIKRSDFGTPKRNDEYGTSVISIQFSRGDINNLSIKNRYNHHVKNPDATYSNNLENIIEGLTSSFEKYYNLKISSNLHNFDMDDFIMASDGRYYHFNYEFDNIYYCDENIIIKNGKVIKKYIDKSRYLIIDYFIFDLKEKSVSLYDNHTFIHDSFTHSGGAISKFEIVKDGDYKNIIIYNGNEDLTITIKVDRNNRMIEIVDDMNKTIENNYLKWVRYLEKVEFKRAKEIDNNVFKKVSSEKPLELIMPEVIKIGDSFLNKQVYIKEIYAPKLETIGEYVMGEEDYLQTLDLPSLRSVGSHFLFANSLLKHVCLPNLERAGDDFLCSNNSLLEINLPSVTTINDNFMAYNSVTEYVNLPNVKYIGDDFLSENVNLKNINVKNVIEIGHSFLASNSCIEKFDAPRLKNVGSCFLASSQLEELSLPSLIKADYMFMSGFLKKCERLKSCMFPCLEVLPYGFMKDAINLEKVYLPNVRRIDDNCMVGCKKLNYINLDNVIDIGNDFLKENNCIEDISLPNVNNIGRDFLADNTVLNSIYAPKLANVGIDFLLSNNNEEIAEFKSRFNYKVKKRTR